MIQNENFTRDNHIDDYVDDEIRCCLSCEPSSFFTFAGAGSGKTTSLIKALNFIVDNKGDYFKNHRKKVAVITYTNAACDEIMRRSNNNSIFYVSTIHSFLWSLIENYQQDIRGWVINDLQIENEDLKTKIANGRVGKAQKDRISKLDKNLKRLENINDIKKFSYSPNGENYGNDSLSHAQVIKMGSYFIKEDEMMQKILIAKYPIILVDESQDTKKELVDALISLEESQDGKVIVGMFGDTMQKIYTDGKDNLDQAIPQNWKRLTKVMNHRSGKRIVELANEIRKDIDDKIQVSRSDARASYVQLFIAESSSNKKEVEKIVASKMAEITGDEKWKIEEKCKSLILEHHMAASRFGFMELYTPLHEEKTFDTQLREGTVPELVFLEKVILPIVDANRLGDEFKIAMVVEENSPLLSKDNLLASMNKKLILDKIDRIVFDILDLWSNGKEPLCIDVYRQLKDSGVFELPLRVTEILGNNENEGSNIVALRKALTVPFTELEHYIKYVRGESSFDTHQGVKGLEFERVLVVIDDEESKGFLFSYEKLFGVKEKTETDIKNEKEGKDTSLSRTQRLFYVACTRATHSLAVIAYTSDIKAVKATVIKQKWFLEDEINIIK